MLPVSTGTQKRPCAALAVKTSEIAIKRILLSMVYKLYSMVYKSKALKDGYPSNRSVSALA
jgi:hypothetical protein